MSEDAGPAQALRQLLLVTRRELAVRVRGTAFRVSTIILLIVTAAGIAIPVKLIGGPQHFTVAVSADAPPAMAAAVRRRQSGWTSGQSHARGRPGGRSPAGRARQCQRRGCGRRRDHLEAPTPP
jgi:hypothetical protein